LVQLDPVLKTAKALSVMKVVFTDSQGLCDRVAYCDFEPMRKMIDLRYCLTVLGWVTSFL
jgi:hypothetical protein